MFWFPLNEIKEERLGKTFPPNMVSISVYLGANRREKSAGLHSGKLNVKLHVLLCNTSFGLHSTGLVPKTYKIMFDLVNINVLST